MYIESYIFISAMQINEKSWGMNKYVLKLQAFTTDLSILYRVFEFVMSSFTQCCKEVYRLAFPSDWVC